MKRILALLLLILPAAARPATLAWPIWRPEAAHVLPAYRGDRFSIKLESRAARVAAARVGHGLASATGVARIDEALAAVGGHIRPEFRGEKAPPLGSGAPDFTAFFLVDLPRGADLSSALDRFGRVPEVAAASPIGITSVTAVPNDSMWATSWHFYQPSRIDIHAPEAWDITRGDTSIVVAIIDTGVMPYHPDIGGSTPGARGQIWINRAEAEGRPGVDDDGNGFVDDVWGWDFVSLPDSTGITPGEDWRDEDNDPNDYVGHGTSVAGLVGALTDNQHGIAGTAWNVRLMPLRVGWSMQAQQTGVVDMSDLAQAIRYATRMGANVINISLSTTALLALDAAVDAAIAAGVTVVMASGNNGSPNGVNDRPGLIQVTATDRNDVIPPWANVGSYVDFAAPGAAIPTTSLRRTGTDSLSLRQPWYVPDANGTSFAAPIASGAVALLQSRQRQLGRPLLTPEQVRLVLMGACDDISAQNPNAQAYYGAGRLNVLNALQSKGSFRATQLPSTAVGAAVEYLSSGGARRIAVQVAEGRLALLDAETLDRVGLVDLGGAPVGDLAAADLGQGRGLGFFATIGDHAISGLGGGGATLPGWPVTGNGTSMTAPALGDLDGDGHLDVVAVSRDAAGLGTLWAWNDVGQLRPGFPVSLDHFLPTGARPALGDLDGAPGLEIVVTDADGWVYAFTANGQSLAGWPVHVTGTPYASPVITRNGAVPEVVVTNRTEVHVLGPTGQTVLVRSVLSALQPFDPILADLDGDGVDDVLETTPNAIHAWFLGGAPPAAAQWPVAAVGRSFLESAVAGHLAAAGGFQIMAPTSTTPVLLDRNGAALPNLVLRSPAIHPTLAAPLHAQRTVAYVAYGPLGFLSMDLADSSWSDDPQPWPTARGNFARTGSRWGAPAMAAADDRAPGPVQDLVAQALDRAAIRLTWTAPSDEGSAGRALAYDLRSSAAPISDVSFTSQPRVPGVAAPRAQGTPETLLVAAAPLAPLTYFRLRARDGAGNWSVLSNSSSARTPGAAPDSVSDLRVAVASESTLALSWTGTGDDGWIGRPARYRIAASPLPMTAAEFARAPFVYAPAASADAGAPESTVIGPLPADTGYHLAMIAEDGEGLRSALSNLAEATTPPIGSHVEDQLPPNAVVDLAALVVDRSSARLTWSAPGDDAALNRAAEYDLRQSGSAIKDENFASLIAIPTPAWPRSAGAPETLSVPIAGGASTLYFALRSMDPAGHWSALSNVASITSPTTPPMRIVDLQVTAVTESTVALCWTAPVDSGTARAVAYVVGAGSAPLTFDNFNHANRIVPVPRAAPGGAPESTVVGGLSRWTHYWIAVRTRTGLGVVSALSNQVEAQTLATPDQPFALELVANPATPPVRLRWSRGPEAGGRDPVLVLHDIGGRRVRTLALERAPSGVASWDGTDEDGRRLPAGVYFATFSTSSRRSVQRFVLLP